MYTKSENVYIIISTMPQFDRYHLERLNPHWERLYYEYPIERDIVPAIKGELSHSLMIAIYGLRRVGKTVVMKQIINHLMLSGVEPLDILYLTFDDFQGELMEAIGVFERIRGRRVGKGDYIFLDEVQKVPRWEEKVKVLYDISGAKIIVSGSASAPLRRGGETLAGRIVEFVLEPLSFREYLRFRGMEDSMESPLDSQVEREYWRYIRAPFPQVVLEDINPKEYVRSIYEKTLFRDLPELFSIEYEEKLFQLFYLIRQSPGFIASYENLASELGVDRRTISRYVEALERGYLVRKLYNYSKNPFTERRKLKKLYPYVAAFCEGREDSMVETAVAEHLQARFFYRDKQKREVDFVLPERSLAVEVKYRSRIRKGELRGLKSFMEKFDFRGMVVSKSRMDSPDEGITVVPYFRLPKVVEEMGIKPYRKV